VVINQPTSEHGGLLEIITEENTKGEESGIAVTAGFSVSPSQTLRDALANMRNQYDYVYVDVDLALSNMARDKPPMGRVFCYQGADHDNLFKFDYKHRGNETCENCDRNSIFVRTPSQRPAYPRARRGSLPTIHYGTIVSMNAQMVLGGNRDEIAKELNAICFESEAVGMLDTLRLPYLVVRGICDYADSHRNTAWQPYAAATAAASAKKLLSLITENAVLELAGELLIEF
jgi:nucleoside phosphorylase